MSFLSFRVIDFVLINDWKASYDNTIQVVNLMLERYEDLDEATARADFDEFLDSVKIAIEE